MALYVQTPAMGTTRMTVSNHFQGTIHSLEVSKVNIQYPAPRATPEGQSVGSVFSKHVCVPVLSADATYCVRRGRPGAGDDSGGQRPHPHQREGAGPTLRRGPHAEHLQKHFPSSTASLNRNLALCCKLLTGVSFPKRTL